MKPGIGFSQVLGELLGHVRMMRLEIPHEGRGNLDRDVSPSRKARMSITPDQSKKVGSLPGGFVGTGPITRGSQVTGLRDLFSRYAQ
jgi:hypothetical protein